MTVRFEGLKPGDVFTIDGIYLINPDTGDQELRPCTVPEHTVTSSDPLPLDEHASDWRGKTT